MVTKAVLDTLLLFVNYSETSTDSSSGGNGMRSGRDSPQRTGSPDSASGFNTAQLLKEAVEIFSESKGNVILYSVVGC